MTPMQRALRRDAVTIALVAVVCLAALAATFWWPSLALWTGRVAIGALTAAFWWLAITAAYEAGSGW